MEHENRLKNGLDMLYLAACALHGEIPDVKRVAAMDIHGVMSEATRHSMNGVAYLGIQAYRENLPNAPIGADAETVDGWKAGYARIVKQTLMFAMEREKILSFFDRSGIWYMPMKGIILQNLYPRIGMRQMVDNDILFDGAYRAELKEYMLENGYQGGRDVGRIDAGCHDTYLKKPMYNFEMHYSLHPATEASASLRKYFSHIKERLIKDSDHRCGYHMGDEDFYIYILTHAYKHYSQAGNGVRAFMDIYVYLSKKQDGMDFAYIEKELSYLGMADFERLMRAVAFKLFSEPSHKNMLKFTAEEADFLAFHIDSGVYGHQGNLMKHKLDRLSGGGAITFGVKCKYFLRRLIPEMDCYMFRYPLAYKYKVLIPFALIARCLSAVCKSPKRLFNELKALTRMK